MTSTLFMIDGVQQYNVMDGQPIILYDSTNAKTSTIVQTGNDMIFTNATASGDITHDAKVALNLDIDGGQELVLTAAKLNPVTTSVFDIGDATHVYQKGFFEEIGFYDTTGAESGSITRTLTDLIIESGTGGNYIFNVAGIPKLLIDPVNFTMQMGASGFILLMDAYQNGVASSPNIYFRKSNNNGIGVLARTTNNTQYGSLVFWGVNAGPFRKVGASIRVVQVGATGAEVPASITFATSSSTAAELEVLVMNVDQTISHTAKIFPATTSAVDIGDATHVYQKGFFEEIAFYDTTGAESASITRSLTTFSIDSGTGGTNLNLNIEGNTELNIQVNALLITSGSQLQFGVTTINMVDDGTNFTLTNSTASGDISIIASGTTADIILDSTRLIEFDAGVNFSFDIAGTPELTMITTKMAPATTSVFDLGDATHVYQTVFAEVVNFYDTTGAENASISRNLTEFLFNSGTGGEIIFQVAGTPVIKMDASFNTLIGDGGTTNYAAFAADGELTLEGTARVKKEVGLIAVSLAPGQSGPVQSIVGDYIVQSFTINDDVVAQIEIPSDWDPSTAIDVHLHWGVNEAEATVNGEVQWQIDWSATPTGEDYSNPTHSGVLDSGDISIATNAREQIHSDLGAIPSASLSVGDFIGLTLTRVALDGGNDPTAEPEVLKLELEYTCNKLGEAT